MCRHTRSVPGTYVRVEFVDQCSLVILHTVRFSSEGIVSASQMVKRTKEAPLSARNALR